MKGPVLELRVLEKADAEILATLARREGRNLHHDEFDRLLGMEGATGVVLLAEGAPVAAMPAMRYFEHAFLGPLLADPERASDAHRVLAARNAVHLLQSGGVARIEAAAAGVERVLLEGLGFSPLHEAVILERPAGAPGAPPAGSSPLELRHLVDLGALDGAAVGYGRKEYLLALRDEFPTGARALERDGDLAGYAFLRRSRRGYHLGPVVTAGDDAREAAGLARDAVAAVASWPVVAIAPAESPLVPLLEREGFALVGALTRLRLGGSFAPAGAREWLLGGRLTG